MECKIERYKSFAKTLNSSKGQIFWKAKNLFTRTDLRNKTKGMSFSKWQNSPDSYADKIEQLRSTFFADSHLDRNAFD